MKKEIHPQPKNRYFVFIVNLSVTNIERRSEVRYGTCRTPQAFVCPDVKVPSEELKIAEQLYTLRNA